ncbi:MAG: hypothetical protein A3D38_01725 [Candidatus Portnoybacteria bacterium RIFCSPHIGHO2_02_FULL_40_23]|uniref:Polymerase nucleotidyl transferase domain-containing protein n=3 Tax=Candidatus Portnoyibacteriota TaxID=1817913 RepID=A0A1G2FB05_9BACT|nr:MAG: hypothetical protein A2815_02735 [Candidatus Portnoybacteria bacterium RIFCSPHIGHO2_01_FULL_40_12b]OGZ37233.1 MAG: hypothetical protein A3D38_01725 [Candidatus Portnoybacteria bacterium RIFCSPHIGHO2_02_FULL_40_23]OGZ38487.1 MAG: hypothetical protein A3E90_00455 [Candidatus Portnoybacteria bacterium RIFCSPHIGHO2_12_FULL_40_11]OGZ40900.1 MAG: hypothetical protein A3I20_01635 [Candidatus Portnoybacteria bacterium RIFCSPLOWO2_02_FULL_40_15]
MIVSDSEKAIISTLVYYDLLDYPLTGLEVFKYLSKDFLKSRPSFLKIQTLLENGSWLKNIIEQKNGFYFLKDREKLVSQRIERMKIADKKWKKIKKISKRLGFVPYLRMIGVTGSLTLNNTRPESDLDLLLITKPGRIWTSRFLATGLISLMGKKRRTGLTKDKICLNCYLTEQGLEIKPEIKPHNLHAAYEYFRLLPLLEIKLGLFKDFQKANTWLKNNFFFLQGQKNNLRTIKADWRLTELRVLLEKLLNNKIGDFLEKKLGQWQKNKIAKKLILRPDDQVVFTDYFLMFHPHSKAPRLMKAYNSKIKTLFTQ